jgi:threonine dehydratase
MLTIHAKIVADRAGAVALAAALPGLACDGKVVCIVSGGNIDAQLLAKILEAKHELN